MAPIQLQHKKYQKAIMRKKPYQKPKEETDPDEDEALAKISITAQLVNSSGEVAVSQTLLPLSTTTEMLDAMLQATIGESTPTKYSFFVNGTEVKKSLGHALGGLKEAEKMVETNINIVFIPQASFFVRSITRCSASIEGHTGAVTIASFSPDGKYLVTGSADNTVRFWDVLTQTPIFKPGIGHKDNVFDIAWSPDCKMVASVCRAGLLMFWNPKDGTQIRKTIVAHRKPIHRLSWEPFHQNPDCHRIVTASADSTAKVWNVVTRLPQFVLSHDKSVKCAKWGGAGLIYTGSQDLTVRVWRAEDGILCRVLKGHANWVTTLTLNTDYVLRTGPFDPIQQKFKVWDLEGLSKEQLVARALKRYRAVKGNVSEKMISSSVDNTMFFWHPETDNKPVARLLGHQATVIDVRFSPDCIFIASASFDKSIRLWDATSGKYVATLRGHILPVYRIAWSPDSRHLISGSKDSTLKLWNIAQRKLEYDLPGHADEVYTVDWSPDGTLVASGGLDKVVKIWRC